MTGWAASAIATHTPNPTGASGSAPCQPAPVPRANAITTTPPSASSFAAVTTFCTHRPDATPTRLIPVNRATSPAPSGAMSAGGQPERRTRNSPAATPIRSEEHTSELQSHHDLVCRLLLEKKKKQKICKNNKTNTSKIE